jgi:uncharacterized membrane protein YgcG
MLKIRERARIAAPKGAVLASIAGAIKLHRRFKIMNIFGDAAKLTRPASARPVLVSLFSFALLFASSPQNLTAQQDPQDQQDAQGSPQQDQAPPYTQQTTEQLQQLVAPIALYPDSLVAQVLGAATYPEQVVEADRWVQAHPDLKGDALAQAVDQQTWDPSVKALTAFPSVLGNMDKNLSWTSSLGDAYYNQQKEVMDAVQVMRQRAQQAGNLKSTPQQTVSTQGSTVVIQPADPTIVYVPAYNPWIVYGGPIGPWPGWYPYPGIWYGGPYLSFGVGFGIGFYGGYGWGWGNWGFNWHNHYTIYNNNRYYSRSNTFYNRNNYYNRGGYRNDYHGRTNAGNRGGNRPPNANIGGRGGVYRSGEARPFNDNRAARGYAQPRGQSGTRSSAFSGFDRGGQTRSFSERGNASFGGWGGGGGFRGGGGGGRRR